MQKWTGKPWERQKEESEKAFEAFAVYKNMGANRTAQSVATQLQKSYTLIRRWKDRWDWEERVRLYDNDIEKAARAKAIKDAKEMTDRHVKIAMQLQKKALEALKELSIDKMSPKDIKEYIKMATDLERLNRLSEDEDGNLTTNAVNSLADTIIAAYNRRKEISTEDSNA